MNKPLENHPERTARTSLIARTTLPHQTKLSKQIILASLVTIAANALLSGVKFVIGFASHSATFKWIFWPYLPTCLADSRGNGHWILPNLEAGDPTHLSGE